MNVTYSVSEGGVIYRNNKPLNPNGRLNPMARKVMQVLVNQQGQKTGSDEICRIVWGNNCSLKKTRRNLHVQITIIRKGMGKHREELRTLRGPFWVGVNGYILGYR